MLFNLLIGMIVSVVASYDNNLSKTSSILESYSYCDTETIKDRLENTNFVFDENLYDEYYDTNGYICHDETTVFVILRGSTSIQDWKDDFDLKLDYYDDCKDCYVHKGFYNYAMAIKDVVINTINTYETYNVVFVGHSLGSSVILLANELYTLGRNSTIITFGSPRIGNEEFATYTSLIHDNRIYRHTHYKDVVVHIPTLRFMHVSGEIYEDEYGNLTLCNGYEDENCSQQFSLYETNVDDHMWYLGTYIGCYVPFILTM